MTNRRCHPFFLFLLTVLAALPGLLRGQDSGVQGELGKVGSFDVLRVWGTPEEMGYAHGHLLGEEFAAVYQADLAMLSGDRPKALADAWKGLMPLIELPDDLRAELEAFVEGANAAAGGELELEQLGRPLQVSDLVLYNARDMIRAFGCSGFTVWGEAAGEAGVVTTRNFDFPMPGEIAVDNQLVMVRFPDGGNAVAMVTWPGYLGAFTGINEHGVCAFMHDGTGGRLRQPAGRYHALTQVMRGVLRESRPEDAAKNAEEALREVGVHPFSYLVRVVTPRVPERDAPPATVLRIDREGVSRNPSGNGECIVTNHYVGEDGAVDDDASGWSKHRFDRLEAYLEEGYDPATAWQAMGVVAAKEGWFQTLHTVVVRPEEGALELAFCTWNGEKVVPATESGPETLTFEALFDRPGRWRAAGDGEARAIRESWDAYVGASMAKEGEQAVGFVARPSVEAYERIRKLALYAGREELCRASLMVRMRALTMRATWSAETLEGIDGRGLLVKWVDEGRLELGAVAEAELAGLELRGDRARGWYVSAAHGKGPRLEFYREEGRWRVDIESMMSGVEEPLRGVLRRFGEDENEALLRMLAMTVDESIDESLWEAPRGR